VARNALWENDPDLARPAGKPVRLGCVMRDADLCAIRLTEAGTGK